MRGTDQSEAVIGLIAAAVAAIFVWVNSGSLKPDPWDAETAQLLEQEDAVALCPHCLTPTTPTQWFCESCGTAVGACNNFMPYVYIFSQGEVLRNGTTGRIPVNATTVGGYFLLSLCSYAIFAPVYWCFLVKNLRRIRQQVREDEPG